MKKWIILLLTLSSLPLLSAEELNFEEASRIVVQSGGRKKPFGTFAAESMQTISGRRAIKDPETGQRIDSVDALLSMWLNGREWKRLPIILVSDATVRKEIGLPGQERMFSFETLVGNRALMAINTQIQAKRAQSDALSPLEKQAEIIFGRMELLNQIIGGDVMTIVPDPKNPKGEWLVARRSIGAYGQAAGDKLLDALKKMSEAYLARDNSLFVAKSRELRESLAQLSPNVYPSLSSIDRELHYNQLHPFRWAWLLYLAAFFIVLAPKARWLGLSVFGAGLVMNSYGFVLRCLIAGHAPVTNMYESVVWVSLGIAAFALVFDLIYRSKVYLLTAAPLAVLGLILADMLPSVLNPNIGPLPPVLRDNFWLATHVLTITLGYSAFALAMGLGHVILFLCLFKPATVDEKSHFHHLLYRVLQIGVLLLAVGTILGGVWANYSWGRFWGWDPKETWALIALLLYIFALHGRIVGWWRNFGLSVAAVICFNGILMAWYGVNFVLGKGLHSYGFGGGGGQVIGGLIGLDLLFVGYCVWRRMRTATSPCRAPKTEPAALRGI